MDSAAPNSFTGESLGSRREVSGKLRLVETIAEADRVDENSVVYVPQTQLDVDNVPLFYAVVRAGAEAILCDFVGETDHGVLLVNELDVPCLRNIPASISDHEYDEVQVRDSTVEIGATPSTVEYDEEAVREFEAETETALKVNLGFPEVVERRPDVVAAADGVGFMRLEFVILDVVGNQHPNRYMAEHSPEAFATAVAERVERVVSAFAPKPVWIRTDDFAVSQLRRMAGGEQYEEPEDNSMLGWRGISRSIDDPALVRPQFEAIRKLLDRGYENVGIYPPMTRFPEEYEQWQALAREAGVEGDGVQFGLMVETPSAALQFEDFVDDIEFAVFGTNDLTQFTLAIDRHNERLQRMYDPTRPAVTRLLKRVIELCDEHDVVSSIGGSAASDPELVTKLIEFGIDELSVNPDPVTLNETAALLADRTAAERTH